MQADWLGGLYKYSVRAVFLQFWANTHFECSALSNKKKKKKSSVGVGAPIRAGKIHSPHSLAVHAPPPPPPPPPSQGKEVTGYP